MDGEGGAGRRSGWDEQVVERGENVDEGQGRVQSKCELSRWN